MIWGCAILFLPVAIGFGIASTIKGIADCTNYNGPYFKDSPKGKAFSNMLDNAGEFIESYRVQSLTSLGIYDLMKSNFWNNDDYRMKIAYADNLIYSTKSKFITCFTEKNKVLRNEVQAVLGKDFHSTDSDKLFFHDLIECFNPKYFPNIITNKFDQDLERSWRQKHKLFTFKKRLCMTLMVLLGLALALSPIIYSVANYYGV